MSDPDILRSFKERAKHGINTGATKEEVVSESGLRKAEEKKWRWHRAVAMLGCVNVETQHEDTKEIGIQTISIGEAVGRAVSMTGTGDNWKQMQEQLLSAAEEAAKLQQKYEKKEQVGLGLATWQRIRTAIRDEIDRMKGRRSFEFKE